MSFLFKFFGGKNKTTPPVPTTAYNKIFVPYKPPLPSVVEQYIAGNIRFNNIFVPYFKPYVPLESRHNSKKSENTGESIVTTIQNRIPKCLVPYSRNFIHWFPPIDLLTSVLFILKEYCGGQRDGKENVIQALSILHMTCHSFSRTNMRLLSRSHRKYEIQRCKNKRRERLRKDFIMKQGYDPKKVI